MWAKLNPSFRGVNSITLEDLGPGISSVGISVAKAFFHVISSRYLTDLLEERRVVGNPISLFSPQSPESDYKATFYGASREFRPILHPPSQRNCYVEHSRMFIYIHIYIICMYVCSYVCMYVCVIYILYILYCYCRFDLEILCQFCKIQILTHILPHDTARHLLQDSEKAVWDFMIGLKAIHHCNHP